MVDGVVELPATPRGRHGVRGKIVVGIGSHWLIALDRLADPFALLAPTSPRGGLLNPRHSGGNCGETAGGERRCSSKPGRGKRKRQQRCRPGADLALPCPARFASSEISLHGRSLACMLSPTTGRRTEVAQLSGIA